MWEVGLDSSKTMSKEYVFLLSHFRVWAAIGRLKRLVCLLSVDHVRSQRPITLMNKQTTIRNIRLFLELHAGYFMALQILLYYLTT